MTNLEWLKDFKHAFREKYPQAVANDYLDSVYEDLLKLRAREKQLEAQEQYATSRLCVAHRGHWQAGRCVICDLERAESRLRAVRELAAGLLSGAQLECVRVPLRRIIEQIDSESGHSSTAEHVGYLSWPSKCTPWCPACAIDREGPSNAVSITQPDGRTITYEVIKAGSDPRCIHPPSRLQLWPDAWVCSLCGASLRERAGEDREQKAPLRGRKPGDGCGKFW